MAKRPPWTARPATFALLLICTIAFVAVYVASLLRADKVAEAALHGLWMMEDDELLGAVGGLVAARAWIDGQWWRTLSAALLHGSWLHLVLNGWSLWSVGEWTERVWGPWRQLALFAWASLGGCLASLAWAEAHLVVGASGGIFGLAGALLIVRVWGTKEQQERVEPVSAKSLALLLVFCLVLGDVLPRFELLRVAQAGHVGGLVFGCLLGSLWTMDPARRGARAAMTASMLAALLGLFAVARQPDWRPSYYEILGRDYFNQADYAAGLAKFERALAEDPNDASLHNYVAYTLAEEGLELERGKELVERALELDSDNADYLDTLGWVQCQLGETEAGMESLRAAEEVAAKEIPEIGEHMERCAEVGVPRGTPG